MTESIQVESEVGKAKVIRSDLCRRCEIRKAGGAGCSNQRFALSQRWDSGDHVLTMIPGSQVSYHVAPNLM